MTTTTENGDDSVLQLFDPLISPIRTKTSGARERDPQSPVAAFFSTVDKSKHFLATRERPKEPNLIDLGVPQSPPQRHEHVEDASSARVLRHNFATPAPLSNMLLGPVNTPRGHGSAALPIDPFSPPSNAGAVPFQSIAHGPRFVLTREDDKQNRLIPVDTPAKPDLFMSTNFTPVPANLPYLPESSLRSLAVSSASSTATRRRRSSIDLDSELHQSKPDSSFDILTGEMELGSAEASFVSVNAHDLTRALEFTIVEESPWTMRSNDINFHADQSLLPTETQGSILLAHEIPLPDSCPTSPEFSTGYNEDASAHASKVFSHLRRFSMAKVDEDPLQFPGDESSPGKETISPMQAGRKPITHVRTMSMTSVSSVTSSRSASTVKQSTPSPEKRLGYRRPIVKRPSPLTSTTSSPSKPSAASKRFSRPSVVLKGATSRLSLAGPRASLSTGRTAPAGRASMAPRASIVRGAMAPPPPPTTSSARTITGVRPRMSVASASGRPSMSRPTASTTTPSLIVGTSKALVAPKGVLTSGVRANSNAALASRLSLVEPSAPALKPPAITKVNLQPQSALSTARPRTGPLKPRPSSMILPSSLPMNTQVPASQPAATAPVSKPTKSLPRPRTSSAGAALISRPPLTVGGLANTIMRPTSVAAHRFPRPKSSLSRV